MRCTGAEAPLYAVVRGQVRQCRDSPVPHGETAGPLPCCLWEVHGGADICLQPVEDPTLEQVAAPKEGRDYVGRSPCCCTSVLGGLQNVCDGSTPEQLRNGYGSWTVFSVRESSWRTVFCESSVVLSADQLSSEPKRCHPLLVQLSELVTSPFWLKPATSSLLTESSKVQFQTFTHTNICSSICHLSVLAIYDIYLAYNNISVLYYFQT